MNKVTDFKTPRSMSQAHCWSPEGKAVRADNRNWSIKSKKEREKGPKQWVSRQDEQVKYSFLRRNYLFNHTNVTK